jgi:hypothetical protein
MSKCYVNEKTNEFSSFVTLEGSKIYIENDFLVIDIKTSIYKYKIIQKEKSDSFTKLHLDSNGKKYSFCYKTDLKSKDQWLILYLKEDGSERISYGNVY